MSSFTNKIAIFSTLKPPRTFSLHSFLPKTFSRDQSFLASGCRSPATSCRKGHSLKPTTLCILPESVLT
ncbi:hypothetical protein K450DRAFT_229208 [Umbelopsis ramanniana AG]|uniref:Uncharacterized protein n=1 Tax=Umbelopsis ramanniana AG TaxID=1314678 RepID=A0AAD5HHF7_UMBRA|nr:uncharacterized protein K450DRAFT_229208 [Umbelopsis ramanniana AG]KAI8582138.1 hypothetical protein K450DRAFT_229208 [Umbelopsis ramanniana AG]